MYRLIFLNQPSYQFKDIGKFYHLFRRYHTTELACYALAQLNLEEQEDGSNIVDINAERAVTVMLDCQAPFPARGDQRGGKASVYDNIVFYKQHLKEVVDSYHSLSDEHSKLTMMCLICYSIFQNPYLVSGLDDDIVLVSNKMDAYRLNNIQDMLQMIALVREKLPGTELNLRMVRRKNGKLDLRLFLGNMEQNFTASIPALVEEMMGDLRRMTALNQTMEEAVGEMAGALQNSNFPSMLSIMELYSESLSLLQNITGKYLKQEKLR